MTFLIALLTLLLVVLVLAVITAPLRRAREQQADAGPARRAGAAREGPSGGPRPTYQQDEQGQRERSAQAARQELEAARAAKYREIRDAELDYRTGKLSDQDYGAIDSQLRAEAIEILKRLDRLQPQGTQGSTPGAGHGPAAGEAS